MGNGGSLEYKIIKLIYLNYLANFMKPFIPELAAESRERHEVLNTALGKRRSQAIKWHNKPRTLT